MSTFEDSKARALTMLYLRSQDLSDLTPEELVDKYDEVYDKIHKHDRENNFVKSKTFK